MDLRIDVDGRELRAAWTDHSPETRAAVEAALPVAGPAARWGDELYFDCGVDAPAENATAEVPVGTVAYWPQGNALCLFWGPTPASAGEQPRAASPVNRLARVEDATPLSDLEGGADVRVEAL